MPAVRSAARSDVGRQRQTNEDRYLHQPDEGLFAVIDGVGGYAGGDVAAEEARKALLRRLRHRTGTPEVRLREAVALANNRIYRRARSAPELAQMACVLTAAVLDGDRLYAAHVGDTRLYKIRDGRIEKLTHDHSFVGVREDAGELSEQAAMRHPRRNEILRDVGSAEHGADDPAFVEYLEAPFEPDAALVLCSDGLTDLVTEGEVLEVVQRHAGNPERTVETLIGRANASGGVDNITVVVVEGARFGGGSSGAASGGEAAAARAAAEQPAERDFSWAAFAAGAGAMLVAALLGLGLRALLAPDSGEASAPPTLESWLAEARPSGEAPGAGWTAAVPLERRLMVERLPSGALTLTPLADSARASDPAGQAWLRGFFLPLPTAGGRPDAVAMGLLLEGLPDSAAQRLLFFYGDSLSDEAEAAGPAQGVRPGS
ncbi:MAG: protein phosphatase 2C domain-containing protein [Rhodothermales bacterium]|nr:protein phosphatase 2C domain-containing protein [Rhodothermales bacterium]